MPFPEMNSSLGFAETEDSQYFEESSTDPTLRLETDGGYVLTRPRFTRKPRKLITTGFSFISESSKNIIQAYYDAKRGGSESFPYLHPTTGVTLTVRFKSPPKFKYVGFGYLRAWDVKSIELEQV